MTILQQIIDEINQRTAEIDTINKTYEAMRAERDKIEADLKEEIALSDQQAQLIAELNTKLAAALNKPMLPTPKWEVLADQIIAAAKCFDKFNPPYKMGGDTYEEGGLDCSGFTKLLYGVIANIDLPRVSGDQSKEGTAVAQAEARKGDLLFFTYSDRNDGLPTHVGIYMGGGKMIHTNNNTERIHVTAVVWSTVTNVRRVL